MKYLIVNADDFGASCGINHAIIEGHRYGILTSASLLVNAAGSGEAAELSRTVPDLSLGLHADLRNELKAGGHSRQIRKALDAQFTRFEELIGHSPTHLDSHHNVHRDPRALPHFLDLAEAHGVPLREHSPVRYLSKFYGQWAGETHLEQISADSLTWMLGAEIGEGITELSCHPGHVDPNYSTGYALEREAELRTLCDPVIREVLTRHSIQLISYRHLGELQLNMNA